MITKIKEYFTSDSLWINIIATLMAALILAVLTVLIKLFQGLSIKDSFNWLVHILNSKISFYWFLGLLVIIVFGFIRLYKRVVNEISSTAYTKSQVDHKLSVLNDKIQSKLDVSTFERFSDVYDYRRLKNHPLHELYTINDVESYIEMIQVGNRKKDIYKLEYGMTGLALELKEIGWIHSSNKNKIMDEISKCFTNEFIHQKENLEKVLNTIRVD